MTERERACDELGGQLTAYLDGELAADRVSAVRGHLRECADCRTAARDLALLRDGLRALPPRDPPTSLWANVQAELAAREVADARRPSWRRTLARWLPSLPQLGLGTALAAAAVLVIWLKLGHHADDTAAPVIASSAASAPAITRTPEAPPAPPATSACSASSLATAYATPVTDDGADVAVTLAAAGAQLDATYARAADELMASACEARTAWPVDRRAAFDAEVGQLRGAIGATTPGRAHDRAWRGLIRYLQGAAVRDEIAAIERAHDHELAGGVR